MHGLLAAVSAAILTELMGEETLYIGKATRCSPGSCHPQVDALANKSLISEATLLICEGLHSAEEIPDAPRGFHSQTVPIRADRTN